MIVSGYPTGNISINSSRSAAHHAPAIIFNSNSMRPVFVIAGYFFCVALLAGLIAYPIYLVSGADFERILSRSVVALTALLFYPMVKLLKITDLATLGFQAGPVGAILMKAWLYGMTMLLPISGYFLICGYRTWEPAAGSLIEPIIVTISAVLSGLIIGLIEESLLRGLLQTQITQATNALVAVITVSFIYSSVHFLQAPELEPLQTIRWYSGFNVLFSAFTNLGQIGSDADSWIALFFAGVLLALIRMHTNNILWCIGLHAGWVSHIKIFKSFTDRDNNAACATLAGNYDKYIGELSAAWIIGLLICWFIYNQFRPAAH